MKKCVSFALLFLFLLLLPLPAYGTVQFTIGSSTYSIDQQTGQMDVSPYIKDSRTYLPLRYAALAAGIADHNILWDNATHTATLSLGSRMVQFQAGQKNMLVNGQVSSMDVAPEIINQRIMIPIRYLAQALEIDIKYDASTKTVILGQKTKTTASASTILPGQETLQVLKYSDSVNTVGKDFTWEYNNISYYWHLDVPSNLLDWDRQVNAYMDKFFASDPESQAEALITMNDDIKELLISASDMTSSQYASWADESTNYQWASNLADSLDTTAQADGYDYFHRAEFILSFVGSAIPYKYTSSPELPAQTIIDNGDCKDKSILLAAILKNLGYRVAFLYFPADGNEFLGHMAVGIAFADNQVSHTRTLNFYSYNGYKYYFAETSTANWLLGQSSVDKPADIIVLN